MNIRNFDMNLLFVFKTLFEERNVTRASKKIGITQPAMSNALNGSYIFAKKCTVLNASSINTLVTVQYQYSCTRKEPKYHYFK